MALGEGSAAVMTKTRIAHGLRVAWPVDVRAQLRNSSESKFHVHARCLKHWLLVDMPLSFSLPHPIPAFSTAHSVKTTTTVGTTVAKCPKCGTNPNGKASCCAPHATWHGKCGSDAGEKEHTWTEGMKACLRKSSASTELSGYACTLRFLSLSIGLYDTVILLLLC